MYFNIFCLFMLYYLCIVVCNCYFEGWLDKMIALIACLRVPYDCHTKQ
jgi:hypothetical protein